VPVLLLSTHDDPVHPVATPETMAQLFPSATLVICNNGKDSIKREFPGIIRDFMCQVDGGTHVSGT
jgi:pimeloyl-ACP methyl ester carboxylesterase